MYAQRPKSGIQNNLPVAQYLQEDGGLLVGCETAQTGPVETRKLAFRVLGGEFAQCSRGEGVKPSMEVAELRVPAQ